MICNYDKIVHMIKFRKQSFATLYYRALVIEKLSQGLKYLWTVIKWILITIGVLIAAQIIGYSIGYGIGTAIMDAVISAAQRPPLIS